MGGLGSAGEGIGSESSGAVRLLKVHVGSACAGVAIAMPGCTQSAAWPMTASGRELPVGLG